MSLEGFHLDTKGIDSGGTQTPSSTASGESDREMNYHQKRECPVGAPWRRRPGT